MEINEAMTQNIASIRSAISTAVLRKTMTQDSQSVETLLQGMEQANAKTMQASVAPHLGGNIDISA